MPRSALRTSSARQPRVAAVARKLWRNDELIRTRSSHMEENVAFHRGIILMGGNQRLMRILEPLQVPGYRMQFLQLLDDKRRSASAAEHMGIIDAILAGDATKAERLMREHVRSAGRSRGRSPVCSTSAGVRRIMSAASATVAEQLRRAYAEGPIAPVRVFAGESDCGSRLRDPGNQYAPLERRGSAHRRPQDRADVARRAAPTGRRPA